MTPYEINLLLHIHTTPTPVRHSSILKDTLQDFLCERLIVDSPKSGSGYECTDKGVAHIAQLCNLPFPDVQFVDFAGRRIQSVD